MAKAVKFRTFILTVLGSNPAALTVSFLKDPGIRKINKYTKFTFYKHIQFTIFYSIA